MCKSHYWHAVKNVLFTRYAHNVLIQRLHDIVLYFCSFEIHTVINFSFFRYICDKSHLHAMSVIYYLLPSLTLKYFNTFISFYFSTSGFNYIAIKKKLNYTEAKNYCFRNFTNINASGTLCKFHNKSNWSEIRDLIKTVEYNETEKRSYSTDLRFYNETQSYNFSDGTTLNFTVNITGNSSHECIVTTNRSLNHASCSEEKYFICKLDMNGGNTQGINIYYKVEPLWISIPKHTWNSISVSFGKLLFFFTYPWPCGYTRVFALLQNLILTCESMYIDFKNSLIIHKENTKEITTVAVVLYVIKPHVYFLKA